MSEIILHHYPQSPYCEKVRVGLGIKGLDWRSVDIPRMPPKPELTPLTGGYRRAPVMQIGSDVYCDSLCMLRELDRRHPEPTFYPGGAHGMPWALARWTDGEMFTLAVSQVIAASADSMPADWVADRGRLYFGGGFDLDRLKADRAHNAAQLRAGLGWLDERLAGGRAFILGDAPGLPDVLAYYVVWFLRGRWDQGAAMLSEFSALQAWEKRVEAIGHGSAKDMSAAEALEIAKNAEPATPEQADPRDPQGLKPGMAVSVTPGGDGGDPAVTGTVRAVSRDTIAILREDDRVDQVCVHFPRAGYKVSVTE